MNDLDKGSGVFRKGERVIDVDGTIGTVISAISKHNIIVKYDAGGKGLYCMEPSCEDYEGDLRHLTLPTGERIGR